MHLFVVPSWFNCLLFAALAVLAVWKGGRRERIIAVAQAVEMLVSIYLYPVGPTRPTWREPVYDGLILAICLVCAVRADRYWTIWACSFALLGEISDLSLFAGATHWAGFSASLLWSYAVAAAVLWGVLTFRGAGNVAPPAAARSVMPPDTIGRTRP
jgi:hypothetical protein